MRILHEDEDIIVIEKEASLAVQTSSVRQKDCVTLLKEHLIEANSECRDPFVGIVHRLDQPVSGVLVFAKNREAAANLSSQLKADDFTKLYRAYVEGNLTREKLGRLKNAELKGTDVYIIADRMFKDSAVNMAVIVDSKNRKKDRKIKDAVLELTVIGYDERRDETCLDIKLYTGRFHQIRCQMANIGHPIVGDVKYGSTRQNRNRGISLCACRLMFNHPRTGKRMSFIYGAGL